MLKVLLRVGFTCSSKWKDHKVSSIMQEAAKSANQILIFMIGRIADLSKSPHYPESPYTRSE